MPFDASFLRTLPPKEVEAAIKSLPPDQAEALKYMWDFWARPNQRLPEGGWTNWLLLAGRGFGKTRTGAETIRKWIKMGFNYANLIGATKDDAREIMVLGESGILDVCPRDERPLYKKNESKLVWPNGATSLIFSADEPERLRGKQHMKLWGDELCAWRYPEAWDQAQFGLRLGKRPQNVTSTTPRPSMMLKEIMASEDTRISTGSSYENKDNLAPEFFKKITSKYEGTRLGRQELEGKVLEDIEGALFSITNIEANRWDRIPKMRRTVVAVDPAVSTEEKSNETGIVTVGLTDTAHGVVIEDGSGIFSPRDWGERAVETFYRLGADVIVAEVNNGGDLVGEVIRSIDHKVPFKPVRATRGKVKRAEPIASLYEQGFIHHYGYLKELEDQMEVFTVDFNTRQAGFSPDRLDALVWGLTEILTMISVRATKNIEELVIRRDDYEIVEDDIEDGALWKVV